MAQDTSGSLPLESQEKAFDPRPDHRARMPEPLPVRLVAVDDVTLPAAAGLEKQLGAFYGGLLEFVRDPDEAGLIYHADNFRLRFELVEGLVNRDTYRPLGVQVQSLRDTEQKLIDAELEYARQRGLTPGSEMLVLLDPAGNWVELTAPKRVG